MWQKRKWIIISVLATVIIVVVGVFGVIAYAQTSTPPSPAKTFAARVAAILSVDQARVEAAMTQAQKEMRTEAFNNRMQELVKAGKLTQEQADNYGKWIQSRPDLPAGIDGPGMKGPGFRGPMMGGPRCFPPPGAVPGAPPASTP